MPSVPKPTVHKQKKRFAAKRDPRFMEWIHTQHCVIEGRPVKFWTQPGRGTAHCCMGPIEGAHVRSRGAGGDDAGNIVSLCRYAHMQQHTWGTLTFQEHWGVDLKAEAERLWADYSRS